MLSVSSVARSEVSVTGPWRPPSREDTAKRDAWVNSDNPLQPSPVRNIRAATRLPVPAKATPSLPKVPEAPPKRSLWAKAAVTVGILTASLGTVAGMLSMVVLGPVGLAVAAGCFVVGTILIQVASKKA